MILNNAPEKEAILSNVGQIGEFRIRNSAKAFSILSSGLYANKIKAIIRELSCNAVDSHVAAGKKDVPFQIHFPSTLEPWFSVRDFGLGLSHDQIIEIYTTYFESTKTDSNAFIGALGLGSKSPFSYTDNFTVITIKDGRKGIYTAFINNEGVPSIALMNEEQTDEGNGVEVRLSVDDDYDYRKFRDEAWSVFKYFSLKPEFVNAPNNFEIEPIDYYEQNVIPGVHIQKGHHYYSTSSSAIMGNINYPIDVPNEEENLGSLKNLLGCGLVMEFDIGELDFQASREGLSYIPKTIASIKEKLSNLNNVILDKIATEANAISNLWERREFLKEKHSIRLYATAVEEYIKQTNFPLINPSYYLNNYSNLFNYEFSLSEFDLNEKYNIKLSICDFDRFAGRFKHMKPFCRVTPRTKAQGVTEPVWAFQVYKLSATLFINNTAKIGGISRLRHYLITHNKSDPRILIVKAADSSKPMKLAEFYESIHNPPEYTIKDTNDMSLPPRLQNIGKNITILQSEQRDTYSYKSNSHDMVWRESKTLDKFEDTETYYYVPLSGFTPLIKITDMNKVNDFARKLGFIGTEKLYGVRKGDIEEVKKKKNWVNIESAIQDKLKNISGDLIMSGVKEELDLGWHFEYIYSSDKVKKSSPYIKFYKEFHKKANDSKLELSDLKLLSQFYTIGSKINIQKMLTKYKQHLKVVDDRYPLLGNLSRYYQENELNAAIDYINAIDKMKGTN